MDFQALIDRYYPDDDELRRLLLRHSRQVADRSLLICRRHPELRLDREFLEESAMLHDIGIRWCHAPGIFCTGAEPYIRHGLIGGQLLRREGYERHARVCERHTGTGLTTMPKAPADWQGGADEPLLPPYLLASGFCVPEVLEEQVVCYADKFYSKSHPERELSVVDAARSLEKFGAAGVEKFLGWAKMFE